MQNIINLIEQITGTSIVNLLLILIFLILILRKRKGGGDSWRN